MTRAIRTLAIVLVVVGFQLSGLWNISPGEKSWISVPSSWISPRLEGGGGGGGGNESHSGGPQQQQQQPQRTILFYPGTSFPDPYDGYDTFSACFLSMDENFRLPETLTYAYHAMPLRYAVIAVDPRSRTSPTQVLDQLRNQGMIIFEWNETDYLSWEPLPENATQPELKDRHILRQRRFYEKCMEHLHEANRTWVYLGDPDEFVSLRVTSDNQNETTELMKKEGWLMRYIRDMERERSENRSCYTIPRLLFGGKDLTDEEVHRALPQDLRGFVDPFRLDTLRYRYHALPHRNQNGHAKVLMDVSRMKDYMPLDMKVRNPHRPLREICQSPFFGDTKDSKFIIHHFLGSWEAYSHRNDSRKGAERSREAWEQRALLNEVRNDAIAYWLKSFVDIHGPNRTTQCLQGGGLPRNYTSGGNADHASWSFRSDAQIRINPEFQKFLENRTREQ